MTSPVTRILFLLLIVSVCSCKNHSNQEEEMPIYKAQVAYEIKAALGEGALWNHTTKEFYWVDIEGKTFNIFNPSSGTNKVYPTPSRAGTVVPYTANEVILAMEDGIHSMDLKTGETKMLTDMSADLEGSRLNDGKCDPSGRLWVGSMHFNQTKGAAKLFMVDQKLEYIAKKDSVTISNGIVWSKDRKTMYYIDTPTAEIKAYDYDDTSGAISNERVVVKVQSEMGFPDGMTIDEEDKLWVGMWSGNAVLRFDPETGKVIGEIEVPAKNVTACAFGGENLDVMYITTASLGMSAEEEEQLPKAGSIFKVALDVKGVPSNFFKQ